METLEFWRDIASRIWGQVPTVVQMIFWGTGSIVAVKTYMRAKKGILQPAKTEVFKLQVAKLQSLLDALNWNGELDAWSRSGVGSSFELNTMALVDAYSATLGLYPSSDSNGKRPQGVASLIRIEVAESELSLIEPGAKKPLQPLQQRTLEWSSYSHWEVHVSAQMQETLDAINRFQADPVIPSFVAEELQALRTELLAAIRAIGSTMDKAAKAMPVHYKTIADVKAAEWSWISNQHPTEDRFGFYDRVDRLRARIRSYLRSDQMFDL